MAANFRMFKHQNSDSLHIKLFGDFDGSSAYELINALESNNGDNRKIYIHTCNLADIHPFGINVLHHNCAIKKLTSRLTFTGEYGSQLAVQGSNIL